MFKLFLETITKKYFKTSNRAGRKEYFSFILFSTLLTEIAGFIFIINDQKMNWFIGSLVFITILFTLYSFIPSITLTVRRLHDLNFSGWWFLIVILLSVIMVLFSNNKIIYYSLLFVLFTGIIYLFFKKGTPTTNKYGEPPTY